MQLDDNETLAEFFNSTVFFGKPEIRRLVVRWESYGFFKRKFLLEIDSHWFQFEPPQTTDHYVLAIVYTIIFIVGCSSNLAVICSLVGDLKTSRNVLLFNLAVSDSLMLVKTPLFVFNSFLQGPALGKFGCQIYGFLGGLSGTASIMTLAGIAFDRFVVIKSSRNTRHPKNVRQSQLLVLAIWTYSSFFASLPLLGLGSYCPEGFLTSCSYDYLDESLGSRIFMFVFFVAAWVIPLTIIVCCYIALARFMFDTHRNVTGPDRRSSCYHTSTETVVIAVFVKLTVLWVAAWTPYAAVALAGASGYGSWITPAVSMVPALLCKVSACANPFAYTTLNSKARNLLLCRDQGRQGSLQEPYSRTVIIHYVSTVQHSNFL